MSRPTRLFFTRLLLNINYLFLADSLNLLRWSARRRARARRTRGLSVRPAGWVGVAAAAGGADFVFSVSDAWAMCGVGSFGVRRREGVAEGAKEGVGCEALPYKG